MPLGPRTRRVFERFAVLVCPPELAEHDRLPLLVREFEAHLRCLPAAARHTVGPTLLLLNQAPRLRPAGRGRSLVRLDDARADAFLRRVLYPSTGAFATAVRLLKSLVVMCYYELAPVKAELGYDPAPYIAQVTARRWESYGPQIRAAEADALRDDPAGAP